MIVITRTYSSALIEKSESGLTDVVTSIYCICEGIDEETGIYETIGEYIDLKPPKVSQFIQFEKLTEEIVDGWVTKTAQYLELEEKVKAGILGRINPVVIEKELPFNETKI